MNEKAPNLGGRIAEGGTDPEGASVLRRKAPALSFCLILLACLAALTLQTLRMLELRRENAALRAATIGLDRLRQDNADLERLRAAAQQAERAQKEQEELEKLRAEVEQLRAVAQELPALRAESQRLATERTDAAARAGVEAEVDPFAEAKQRAQRINCISNIKQICLAAVIWAHDHKAGMPPDFLTMRNELTTPKILTCSADTARTRANDWQQFDGSSVSYELLSPGLKPASDFEVVYVRCPICNNVGMVDGSALQLGPNLRVEKVDGKFKVVRANAPTNPAQQ